MDILFAHPPPGTIFLLVLLVILLICSGCFSATETALFCLDRIERRRLKEDKSRRSRLIVAALQRPRELLSTILFGNTLVNVATSATAALLFARLIPRHSLTVAIVVDSLLVLFIGEIVPKTIAVSQAKPLAQAAIMPLHLFSRISRPVVGIFDRSAHAILRLLKVPEEPGGALSPSELEVLFDEAGRKETITSFKLHISRQNWLNRVTRGGMLVFWSESAIQRLFSDRSQEAPRRRIGEMRGYACLDARHGS